VTVSNPHPHHAWAEGITGNPRVFCDPGEYEIGGALIWGVRTLGVANAEGSAPKNTSFLIKIEDISVCHLGDLGQRLTADQLTFIKDCDVLLVPVGGHCTLGPSEAAEIVAQIEPKVIVPMHYATAETEGYVDLEGVERFCREMGATELVPQGRLNLTQGGLPATPTVVLLERRR
jgi:L-ascorbate metabolism protein UlaG (beta-lactamase superfamily)